MVRENIGTSWNRKSRNSLNSNFIELYNSYISTGVNLDEALIKARDAVILSQESFVLSEEANILANATRNDLDALILDAGESSPEIVSSRGTFSTLGGRLFNSDGRIDGLESVVSSNSGDIIDIEESVDIVEDNIIGVTDVSNTNRDSIVDIESSISDIIDNIDIISTIANDNADKLDDIEPGAEVNEVLSVNGETGHIVIQGGTGDPGDSPNTGDGITRDELNNDYLSRLISPYGQYDTLGYNLIRGNFKYENSKENTIISDSGFVDGFPIIPDSDYLVLGVGEENSIHNEYRKLYIELSVKGLDLGTINIDMFDSNNDLQIELIADSFDLDNGYLLANTVIESYDEPWSEDHSIYKIKISVTGNSEIVTLSAINVIKADEDGFRRESINYESTLDFGPGLAYHTKEMDYTTKTMVDYIIYLNTILTELSDGSVG